VPGTEGRDSHVKCLDGAVVSSQVPAQRLPNLQQDSCCDRGPCPALQIIRAAAERGEATLFFCKIGKDRTGLMAALVLAACGATNDEIISDYNRCIARWHANMQSA
jgi:Tyrosine phosphatase family